MDWDLPQLRAFASIVDHGSLDAAARALHVTPSAVSQRLKALEREVGAVLLQRTRPARPTQAGAAVLRLAREIDALTADAESGLGLDEQTTLPTVRIAVNADSLATWVLVALAPLAGELRIEFLRQDETRTADLLRDGTAMAAVTSQATPVQGCTVEPLGVMRYRPMASAAFARRWFPDGVTRAALQRAPVLVFDENDALQSQALRLRGITARPSLTHVVPASAEFAAAVRLGYGWGMLPDQQVRDVPPGELVNLDDAGGTWLVDVELFWQQWSLRTPSLDRVATMLREAAAAELGLTTP